MMTTLSDLIDRAVTDAELDFTIADTFADRHGPALTRGVGRRRAGRAFATTSTAAVTVGAVAWGATAVSPWRDWLAPAAGACEAPAVAVTEPAVANDSDGIRPAPSELLYTATSLSETGGSWGLEIHRAGLQSEPVIDLSDSDVASDINLILGLRIQFDSSLSQVNVVAYSPEGPIPADQVTWEVSESRIDVHVNGSAFTGYAVIDPAGYYDEAPTFTVHLHSGKPERLTEASVVCVAPEPTPASSPTPSPVVSDEPYHSPLPSPQRDGEWNGEPSASPTP